MSFSFKVTIVLSVVLLVKSAKSESTIQIAQVGSDIYGDAFSAEAGYSIAVSADGSVVAVGMPGTFAEKAGRVRIFKRMMMKEEGWVQIGNDILGNRLMKRLECQFPCLLMDPSLPSVHQGV